MIHREELRPQIYPDPHTFAMKDGYHFPAEWDFSVQAANTAMLYLRDPVASVVRPVQQLIDYRKVELAPGEKTEVTFTVTEKQLRFVDFDCREISEPGKFEISCGYADHLLLTKTFEYRA